MAASFDADDEAPLVAGILNFPSQELLCKYFYCACIVLSIHEVHPVNLRTPVCDVLRIDHPILLAGMGGVSYAEVCAAVCNAGGFGTLGMALHSVDEIRSQMRRVRALSDRPFGVNLLAAIPSELEAAVETIIEEGASAFMAGLGSPRSILRRVKDAKRLVIQMCGTVDHARRAEGEGVDIVVAQGTEAGGHTGRVAGMALIPQVVDAVRIPVIAAGSIVDGRGLVAALALGAQGVLMGTRFIASVEAHAAPAWKQAILDSSERDTVVTRAYSGKTMRVLRNAYVEDWEKRPGDIQSFPHQMQLSMANNVLGFATGALDLNRSKDCMPAGQGAGEIRTILTCAEIMETTIAQARSVIGHLTKGR
jgi:enoyl-[acyl-carrier protein] reductase II